MYLLPKMALLTRDKWQEPNCAGHLRVNSSVDKGGGTCYTHGNFWVPMCLKRQVTHSIPRNHLSNYSVNSSHLRISPWVGEDSLPITPASSKVGCCRASIGISLPRPGSSLDESCLVLALQHPTGPRHGCFCAGGCAPASAGGLTVRA